LQAELERLTGRSGYQALRWTATGLFEAEKKFRNVEDYRESDVIYRKPNRPLTQQQVG
jgi:hypothetical protein